LLSDTDGTIEGLAHVNVPSVSATPPVRVLPFSIVPYVIAEAVGTDVIIGLIFAGVNPVYVNVGTFKVSPPVSAPPEQIPYSY
jgi:hypothetical protein